MNFMVANFLSEQARAHRSSRVSDIRADLVAAQTQATSNASSTSSRINPSSTTEASAIGGDPDGGGGETTGAAGSGSEPLRQRSMVSRSPAASPALDAHALVRSCIGRAEAMLPPHGMTVPWGGARLAPPGLAGLLHVLLLLATGVTETQRETLVSTKFHLRVRRT